MPALLWNCISLVGAFAGGIWYRVRSVLASEHTDFVAKVFNLLFVNNLSTVPVATIEVGLQINHCRNFQKLHCIRCGSI